jgi:sugar lactone lactonase YvrE
VTNAGDNTISQYTIDPHTGVLAPKTPSTIAAGNGPLGVAVSPDGRSAYVTNARDDTVSQYSVDPVTGALSPETHATVATGPFPFGISVSPDGRSAYVTDRNVFGPPGAGAVSQYDIDPLTGQLSPKTPATVAAGAQPEEIAVSHDGMSAYVTNNCDNTVSQYDIDPLTGALSPKPSAAVATGPSTGSCGGPLGIAIGKVPAPHATATSVSCSPGTVVAGRSTACTATVTDTASGGQTQPAGTVDFTTGGSGSFTAGGQCALAPTIASSASCSVDYAPSSTTSSPTRTDTLTAAYGGDGGHTASQATTQVAVISPTLLAHGSFAIGDQNAAVGTAVTFWGDRWSALNRPSRGPAPASFKGFVGQTPNNPPQCGDRWTTAPGGSSSPPATVPQYMEVSVSSQITQHASTISSDTEHVVVVKTNPGYGPEPDLPRTGIVVAQAC